MDCKVRGGEAETHVLLVAFAAQSHINPMLRLGQRLISKGLHVMLATTETARQLMDKANTSSTQNSIPVEFFSDGLPEDFDRTNNLDQFFDSLACHGPPNLSTLIQSLSDRNATKFSCIINNPFVPWVAHVARDHRIPCAMLWIQPCALFAVYYRFYKRLNHFPTVTHPNTSVQLPGLPLLRRQDLPSFVLPSNPWGTIPKALSLVFENIHEMKWVFCNSFNELEEAVVESMSELQSIMPVGPLVPPMLLGEAAEGDACVDLWKAEDGCIEWLDKQPAASVVYVSFGSFLVLSAKQMENLAWGIKKSGRPFLWVVKPPEHAAKDRTGQLPPEFLKETEEEGGGMVVRWCPQAKVLAHPSVGGFLTHVGWNSTLEAVASGVPMICYPQWTDQPTNAKLVTDVFDMGVRLQVGEDGVVEQEEVGRCIAEVVQGQKGVELKKKALQWKEAARAAVRNGGSSDRNIQLFVDEIIKGTN
ncbi:hypothetical protein ACLOJK_003779 [Asimina triloba]